jgi:hypothetical protein
MSFIFQKVGRGVNEIFVVAKNGESSAIGPGNAVCWDYTTDKDGKTVILPTTAAFGMFAGVVAYGKTLAASGADGQWGKVQIYGHHAGVKVGVATSAYPGNPLIPYNASGVMTIGVTHVASISTSNAEIQHVWATATAANSVYTDLACFIRAM